MKDTPANSYSAAQGGGAGTPFPARRMASLMRHALFLAEGNLGATSPNPSVGAVLADAATGEIVASAVTAPGGRPHAEALALSQAGERARGSVLFTTLEPCSHFGATPPCAHSVAEAGVAAVVYGSLDPDMRVAGRGLAWLESHGVQVLRGDFAKEADWLNLGHTLRVTARRPFVQIKLAVDANGRVPAGAGGKPVWITGEAARAQAHLLRARTDAILVGRKTVETDDPELTCRLPGLEDRSPIRVVLAPRCGIPAQARLFQRRQPPMGARMNGQCNEQATQSGTQPLHPRKILNTLIWMLTTGARWCDVPVGEQWASRSCAHKYLGRWKENKVLERVLIALQEVCIEWKMIDL